MLIELVEHLARLGVALQFDDDGDAVAVGTIAQVGDVGNDALVDQLGDALDEQRLVDLVGQFGDVDLHPARRAARHRLDVGHTPDDETAAASGVGVADALAADDDPRRREVRPLDELHQIVERHLVGVVLPVDEIDDGVAQLVEVVGRDVGGHAHGDARRPVEQQVGQSRRQQVRLLQRIVEVGYEGDGVLVKVFQHLHGNGRQPGLGVAHGRRAVAVDAAEVALAIDGPDFQVSLRQVDVIWPIEG